MHNVISTARRENFKDRVEQSRLEAELKTLEQEQKNELRMHDSEAQRFRIRFSKMNIYTDTSEAADVKMYQTHNPGFCYKRDGTNKSPSMISPIPAMDFQQLRNLVFTDNELDIEKILCLHMLSTHRTDTLKMPCMKSLKDIPKENCPLERLIQRSKKINKEKKDDRDILKILPTYIIDVGQCISMTSLFTSREESEDHLFKDSRLHSRLMVNEKLQEILTSALSALKESNRKKFIKIVEKSQDTVYLKKIFNKLSMQEFLKMLRSYSIITCCESYYLSPKIKQQPIHLEVRTIFGHLENIIIQIRTYILQLPSKTKNEWRTVYELDQNVLDEEIMSLASHQLAIIDGSRSSKSTYVRKSSKSVVESKQSSTPRGRSELLNRTASSLGRRAYKNFISRNIQAVKGESITQKVFENSEKEECIIDNSFTSKILSRDYFPPNLKNYIMPSKSIEEEVKTTSMEEVKSVSRNEESEEELSRDICPKTGSFIKKTSCCACQEKWKQPLPSPKIPSYKRPGLSPEMYDNPFKTNRLNQLSSMINDELYRLDSYDTRYSLDNINIKIKLPKDPTPPVAPQNELPVVADSVEISPYDLARISHEISDKETDKKLVEFLKETL